MEQVRQIHIFRSPPVSQAFGDVKARPEKRYWGRARGRACEWDDEASIARALNSSKGTSTTISNGTPNGALTKGKKKIDAAKGKEVYVDAYKVHSPPCLCAYEVSALSLTRPDLWDSHSKAERAALGK